MPAFSQELFLLTLGLIAAVILVSALFSGAVERTGVPQVLVFLAIGALIGPPGFDWVDAGIDSPILRVVSTLSLALVLFTDAVSLNFSEIREHKLLAALVLGPGTIVSAALVSLAAWGVLGLHPALAAILGASLSSTDPVLLRPFLKHPGLDVRIRQALRLESGMNDALLLPVVLVAVAIYTAGGLSARDWGQMAWTMLVLSPGAGVLTALAAIGLLEWVRRLSGIRRDYESIYSLGVAFAAFAAAEAFHGSGFLAAFAAGLTISALDVKLCDCFLEYGETTAEMALLFTFVLFGTSVLWSGFTVFSPRTAVFAALVFLARPAAFLPALLPARIPGRVSGLIAWYGPRGLSSLLLVLIAAFSGVREAAGLVALCSFVVMCSIVLHGFSPLLLGRRAPAASSDESEFLTVETLGEAIPVDARSARTWTPVTAEGAVRVDPDRPVASAQQAGLPRGRTLAVFCA